MNYLRQLNTFYGLLLSIPVSANAQCLYFTLLNINNRCDWKKEFSVANSTLMGFTSLDKQALYRARNELIQKNFIEFKKGVNQNQAGRYKIIELVTADDTANNTADDTADNTAGDTINKLNKTKQKFLKKEIKEKKAKMINDFTKNKKVSQALCDFIEYRENKKNPVTEKALQIMLNKFKNWDYNDAEIIEVLNESIMNNWTGIFELKQRIPQVTPIEEYREIDTSNMTSEEYLALVRGERNV